MSEVMKVQGREGLCRFKPYPAYKESGVEWLGEIPAHWEVKPFKAILVRNDSGVWGEDFDDHGVIVLRSTEQTADGRWNIQSPARRRLGAREASEARLEVGDLVVTKSSGSELHIGKASIVDESVAALNCCFSNFMQRLRLAPPNQARYFWYVLNSPVAREQLVFLSSTTTGLGNLNGSVLGAIRVPVAPEPEQRAITAFLDRETAKIDTLIGKKERLIELLQEKRTALITQAVTKGLNPTVPMKDSGVEWLGEIPAHWDVRRLKHLVAEPLKYGANEPAELVDPELPRYIRITDVQDDGMLRDDTFRSIPEEVAQPHLLAKGDILFARSGATVGKTFLYDPSWGRAAHAGYLVRARLDERSVVPKFVLYFAHSAAYWDWILSSFIQATIQNVSAERYANLFAPVPPLSEQRAIAAFLDRETAKIDALIAKVREGIERLKEYRTALISAAVTGKIDVRESRWVESKMSDTISAD